MALQKWDTVRRQLAQGPDADNERREYGLRQH